MVTYKSPPKPKPKPSGRLVKIEVGEPVVMKLPLNQTKEVRAEGWCGDNKNGKWFCATCGKSAVMGWDVIVKHAKHGEHRIGWECNKHGPESRDLPKVR